MSGIPYNQLQTIDCTVKTDDGESATIAVLNYAFVIPCIDCKHYAEWDEYHPTNPWTCRWCKFWDDQTKVDGFCHAGERKVDDADE